MADMARYASEDLGSRSASCPESNVLVDTVLLSQFSK